MTIQGAWRRIHTWPAAVRWPLKLLAFAVVLLLVLYPRIWLLPTFLTRLTDLERTLDPNHPHIARMAADVRAHLPEDAPLKAVVTAVEAHVVHAVPYAFDWETWGVMCYIPTVDEVFERGREDCDGRAVLAASLLRHMGYEAWLVADVKHMWVAARDPGIDEPPRELMGPGAGEVTLASPAQPGERTAWHLTWGAVQNLGRGLAFGIAVFPLAREIVLVAAVIALTLRPRVRWPLAVGTAVLMLAGLLALRQLGAVHDPSVTVVAGQWLAVAAVAAGWFCLAVWGSCRGACAARPCPRVTSAESPL